MKKILTYISIVICLLLFPFSLNKVIDVSSFIDYVIFIDAGHGGKDNGADYLSIYEDEINLSIAKKLYEKCISKNFMAFMTRTGDYDLSSNYSKNHKNEDLSKRAEIINHSGCDIFISLHINKYSSSEVNGPMVYYEKDDDNSYNLAKCIQKELNFLTKKDKKVHFDNFYLFKNCEKTGVLVECGFISNDEERAKLLNEEYQYSLVSAIYEGIYQHYLSF